MGGGGTNRSISFFGSQFNTNQTSFAGFIAITGYDSASPWAGAPSGGAGAPTTVNFYGTDFYYGSGSPTAATQGADVLVTGTASNPSSNINFYSTTSSGQGDGANAFKFDNTQDCHVFGSYINNYTNAAFEATTNTARVSLISNTVTSSTRLAGTVAAFTDMYDAASGAVTLIGSIAASGSGAFTSAQMTLLNSANVNGVNFTTEYTRAQGSGKYDTEAVTGGIAVPTGSTVHQASAIAGYATNSSTATDAVAIYGQAFALAHNCLVWGSNVVAGDAGFSVSQMYGQEIDIDSTNAASQGAGLTFGGQLQSSNLFSAIQIPFVGNPWQQGISFYTPTADGAHLAATTGIWFQTGATSGPNGSGCAIQFNPLATGTNQASQGMLFLSSDPTSGQHLATIFESATGALTISSSSVAIVGKLVEYDGILTAGNGVPSILQGITVTGLTANYNAGSAKTLVTPIVSGSVYRISAVEATTNTPTGATLPSLTVGWTDAAGVARTEVLLASTSTSASTTLVQSTTLVHTNGSTAVTVTSASYAAGSGTALQYEIAVTCEQLI